MKSITQFMIIAALGSTSVYADQVILDDLIVDGSQCIGFDCVNGEAFGFDALRLKENNVRIHFDDTSNSASFPNNDWRIVINDSTNGGANYFSVEDSTGARRPFSIEAGARANSLYVDSQGDVGIGTSTPVADLHTKSGNTPTLRLEQDGTSGFTPQTWDVASNETNFFIRDATNGSTLPFRIRPGAPTSSIDIDGDGNVGVGTSSPAVKLDVKLTPSDTLNNHILVGLSVDNGGTGNSDTGFSMENVESNFKWTFRTFNPGEGFAASKVGTGGAEFQVDNLGSTVATTKVLMGGVTVFESGHLVTASSRKLKTDIKPLDTQEALEAFDKLKPVSYAYKTHKDEAVVGFIAEDVPDLVAMPSRKSIDSTEIVAVLTSVLAETRAEMEVMRAEIAELKGMK